MVSITRSRDTADIRVALLTNSLSPHTLPLCEQINDHVGELCAFVSAASDTFHSFPRPRASFRIVVQRSVNIFRLRYRTCYFSVSEMLHLPLDTFPHLARYKPEVILSCQFGARTLFAMLYCLTHPGVRLILWAALSTHTEQERGFFRSTLRRWMLRRADAAFVNGASGERYLRSLGFAGRVSSVPYAVEDTLFRSSDHDPQHGERRLLFCGRIDAIKGILRFCRVLHRWCAANPDRQIRFQIIGNGPDIEPIRSLPPLPNLTVHLLPRMDQTQLAIHYRQADLFAFPSLMDEWGVVVNEALSAGLPVLGSIYSQAAVELIADGANGWLCDPQREASLYAALDRALTATPAELQSMSAYARCTANEITPEIVAKRAVKAIADVCGLDASPKPAYASELSLAGPTAISVP